MRRSLLVFLALIVLSACATLVTGRPEYQQLLVTERYDAAYIRAQAVAVGLGLHIRPDARPGPHLHGQTARVRRGSHRHHCAVWDGLPHHVPGDTAP